MLQTKQNRTDQKRGEGIGTDTNATKISRDNIKFEIDFKQFFQYYKVLNARFLADKIGMNPTLLSQYVQGHKKPSETQTKKILYGIHQIGQDKSGFEMLSLTRWKMGKIWSRKILSRTIPRDLSAA